MGSCCASSQSQAIASGPSGLSSTSSWRPARDAATEQAVGGFNAGEQVSALDGLGFKGDVEASARFLHNTIGLDTYAVGDLLGDPRQEELMKAYVQKLEFGGLTLDMALRRLLKGFRLPGEAQKIDRLMSAFAQQFCACQSHGALRLEEDVAYVVSFALIMLNTDLHNPSIKRHMTLQQFQSNMRGLNNGSDFPASWTSELYNNIKKNELVLDNRFTKHRKSISFPALPRKSSGSKRRRKSAAIVPDLNPESLAKLKTNYELQRLKLHDRSRASTSFSSTSAATSADATTAATDVHDAPICDLAGQPGTNPEDKDKKEEDVADCDSFSISVTAEPTVAELELIPTTPDIVPTPRELITPRDITQLAQVDASLLTDATPVAVEKEGDCHLLTVDPNTISVLSPRWKVCVGDDPNLQGPRLTAVASNTALMKGLAGPFSCCICPYNASTEMTAKV